MSYPYVSQKIFIAKFLLSRHRECNTYKNSWKKYHFSDPGVEKVFIQPTIQSSTNSLNFNFAQYPQNKEYQFLYDRWLFDGQYRILLQFFGHYSVRNEREPRRKKKGLSSINWKIFTDTLIDLPVFHALSFYNTLLKDQKIYVILRMSEKKNTFVPFTVWLSVTFLKLLL